MDPEGLIRDVVVVGGGTAGWLTAAILAADHCAAEEGGLRVTLVESASVPILGVGEGTWPSLRDTLRRIGLSETEFVRRCGASFKQGTRFDGWRNGAPDDVYFHPFEAPPSQDDADPLALWRMAPRGTPFACAVSHQAVLCLEGKAPKQPGTPEFAAVANYAYHLDAPAFAELLREHATGTLGVQHMVDDVAGAEMAEDGSLAAIITAGHGRVTGDLFIDCTGSRALLIEGQLGSGMTDLSPILFNDHALAIHVPYQDENEPIPSQTNGTAMAAGWVWDIALQSRRGVGHVFSSRHASEDGAREALGRYLARTAPGVPVSAADARLIPFRSGYRREPWTGNVVAVGMSAGFVEPLEASAIVMIELSATMISDTLPPRRALMKGAAERFNQRFSYRWERIADFLKLHYVLSEREEPYWRDHRDEATWSPRLRDLVARWRYEPPSRDDFVQTREIFPAASYAYVLYGMGFRTEPAPVRRRKDKVSTLTMHLDQIASKARRFAHGLPTNRQLIDHIKQHGLTRV